jgi:hypothetical protein
MEKVDSSPPTEASRVAVRLPSFSAKQPAMWFAQAEAVFTLAGINSEKTKFCCDLAAGPPVRRGSSEHHHSLPQQDPYSTLRTELVKRLSSSREQRIRQLLTLEKMDDLKPSQFHRSLAPDDFLRSIWYGRLPPTYGPFSPTSPRATWTPWTISPRPHPSQRSRALPHSPTAYDDLFRQVAARSAERAHPRSSSRIRRPGSRSTSRDDAAPIPAGTMALWSPGRESVFCPAPTAGEGINAAINGGTWLRYKHRPPLHHRQV